MAHHPRSPLIQLTAVAMAVVLGTGCYTTLSSKITTTGETVLSRRIVDNGSELGVERISESDWTFRVVQVPMCREAGEVSVSRLERKRLSRDSTRYGRAIIWGGAAGGLAGAYAGTQLVSGPDKWSGEKLGDTMLFAALGWGVGLFATMYLIKSGTPESRSTETSLPDKVEQRWMAPAAPCGPVAPVGGRSLTVQAGWSTQDKVLVQTGHTNSQGMASFDMAQQRAVAAYCGDAKILVSAGQASMVSDSPAAPDLSMRLRNPFSDSLPAPMPSQLLVGPQGEALDLARGCCTANVKRTKATEFAESCARDGGAESCLNGRTACLQKAGRADEPAAARQHCGELFDDCLLALGTSKTRLETCVNFMVAEVAKGACP